MYPAGEFCEHTMIREQGRKIVVVNFHKKSLEYIFRSILSDSTIPWAYFGKNVAHFLEIERFLGSRGNNIPVGDLLQENAGKYRQEFIDYLGSCAADSGNPWWYLSPISEKNSYVSDLFLNFCYLKTFFDLASNREDFFFVICEGSALVQAIQENLPAGPGFELKIFHSYYEDIINGGLTFLRTITRKIFFCARFSLRIFMARIFCFIHRGFRKKIYQDPIVIHSWTDHRSFTKDDQYSDVYFGDLAARIADTDQNYFFLLDILPTLFYPSALKKTGPVREPWHLFEEFFTLTDIVRSLAIAATQKQTVWPRSCLCGLEIMALIAEEISRGYRDTRRELSILYYAAGKRLGKLYSPRCCFYTFENHTWEKMFICGIREAAGKTRVTGYAHTTVNSMELSYSVSDSEKGIIPLPDHILVNGKKPRQTLIESGFDQDTIKIVGSLRYGDLTLPVHVKPYRGRKQILVILSADINRSLETIHKVREAFFDTTNVTILLKPHPIQKLSQIIPFVKGLPEHFRLSSEPLGSLLEDAGVVLFTDSTASVEACSTWNSHSAYKIRFYDRYQHL